VHPHGTRAADKGRPEQEAAAGEGGGGSSASKMFDASELMQFAAGEEATTESESESESEPEPEPEPEYWWSVEESKEDEEDEEESEEESKEESEEAEAIEPVAAPPRRVGKRDRIKPREFWQV